MSKNNFQYGGWNSYTLQCGTIMTSISPETAPCNVALESWEWIHQVAAPCNVIRGSGWHATEFARWQHPALWHVALESWQWIHQVGAPCNVTRSSGITTLNSPGGSTLQCGRWLWDDMPLNLPKRLPYWNSTSGFDFHTSPQSTCHSVPVCKIFFQIRPPSAEKNYVIPIFKMADLSHLGF